MKKNLSFMLGCFFGALIAIASANSSLDEKVIYGNDDRKEPYYFSNDPDIQKLIQADVAVLPSFALTQKSNGKWSVSDYGDFTTAQDEDGTCTLCNDEPFYGQPTPSFCSGFLVDSNKIATAGHCVDGTSCENLAFVFGLMMNSDDSINLDNIPDENVFFCQAYRHELTETNDWAVVLLDREVSGRDPLPIATEVPAVTTPLIMVGHPWGLPMKVDNGGHVKGLLQTRFTATTDSYAGNSGSMVVNGDTYEVVGILIEGNPDFVPDGNCCRSNVCSEETGCGGSFETVTKIQTVPDWTGWNSASSSGPVVAVIFMLAATLLMM